MKPVEIACTCLLASAFMLGGLLIVHMGGILEQEAKAEMVVAENNFTIMTTRTKDDEESLFVMNNVTNRLLIYKLNVARKQLELVANESIAGAMKINAGGRGRGDDNDR